MSLDLTLRGPSHRRRTERGFPERIDGSTVALTPEEARALFPNANLPDPADVPEWEDTDVYWDGTITHNLREIALRALPKGKTAPSLYELLWRPENALGKSRRPTRKYLDDLLSCRDALFANRPELEKYEPKEWGTYDGLEKFANGFISALAAVPESEYGKFVIDADR